MTDTFRRSPVEQPETPVFAGESGDGGNRTHGRVQPSLGLSNCSLVPPTERTHNRVRLPVVRLPHDWHEDTWVDVRGRRRSSCTTPGYRKGQPPASKGKTYPATPPTPQDMAAILNELWDNNLDPKHGPIGLRNRALVVTLWRSGLRIHEALLLTPADLDFEHCTITVRRGKGGKRRISGIDRMALWEINMWLLVRAAYGFTLDQPIFCVLEGKTRGGLLSQPYVRTKLHEAANRAGVLTRVAPHQLRHALAVELARAGVPVPLISRQLGHSNVATTATYLAGIAPEEVVAVMAGRSW